MLNREWLLKAALATCGGAFFLVYPLAIIWPSGWVWHYGAPHESEYFVMIVGIYATLGVFLLRASRDPGSNLSLIWFTIWSSLVHAGIMAIQQLQTLQSPQPAKTEHHPRRTRTISRLNLQLFQVNQVPHQRIHPHRRRTARQRHL